MGFSRSEIPSIVTPLRFIFWGGLICIFDLNFASTSNGEGFRFDLLNDFVGMLMITWGVFRLASLQVDDRYRSAMLFVQIVAVLSCIEALHAHVIYDTPLLIAVATTLLGIAALIATVLFCVAMQWLSDAAGLQRAAASWQVTTILFVAIYLIPLGLFYSAALLAMITGNSFQIDLGPAGLLLLPVFCIPLVHLFISTSRMRADAEVVGRWDEEGQVTA